MCSLVKWILKSTTLLSSLNHYITYAINTTHTHTLSHTVCADTTKYAGYFAEVAL